MKNRGGLLEVYSNWLEWNGFDPIPVWIMGVIVVAWLLGYSALFTFLTGLPSLLRNRRSDLERCRLCGYNLKGLTEPRCPECGTPFEMQPVEPASTPAVDGTDGAQSD